MLVSVKLQGLGAKAKLPDMSEANFADEELAKTWKDFKKAVHQFDIRQQRCKFYIIQGEVLAKARAPEQPGRKSGTSKEPGASPSDVPELSQKQFAGQRIVKVVGRFPGKDAECALEMQIKADQYNEEKILAMLKSIR